MDILFKEIENRKYGLLTYRKNNSHWMLIEDGKDEVYFQLREKGDRTDVSDEDTSWPEYEYIPTGELQLVLFRETYDRSGRVLSDTQTQKLEDRLDKFFFKLESMAEKLKMERLKREKRLQKRELERQIEKAIKQQEKAEDERLDILEQRANTFTKSQYIYDFVAEIEKQQSQLDLTEEEKLKFKGWIIWARDHADRLNPIKQTLNEILKL